MHSVHTGTMVTNKYDPNCKGRSKSVMVDPKIPWFLHYNYIFQLRYENSRIFSIESNSSCTTWAAMYSGAPH